MIHARNHQYSSNQILLNIAMLVVALVVSLGTLVVLSDRYSQDIPIWDDYDIFLGYINHPDGERFTQMFVQHNEHKVVFARFVAEILYHATGSIDFRTLIFIGNLALLFVLLTYLALLLRGRFPIEFIVPIPFLLLNLTQWHNIVWATGSLQHNWAVLLALLSLVLFVSKSNTLFGLSLVFASLTAFTSGSGLFLFLIMLAVSAANILSSLSTTHAGVVARTESTRIAAIIVVFAIVLMLYFSEYKLGGAALNPERLTPDYWKFAAYFLTFIGSYTKIQPAALLFGIGSVAAMIFLTLRGQYARHPALYLFLVFLILSALAVTLRRYHYDLDQALSSRYTIYSINILIVIHVMMTTWLTENWLRNTKARAWTAGTALFFALAFYGYSLLVGIPKMTEIRSELRQGMAAWHIGINDLYHDEPQRARVGEILKKSIELGTYKSPE
jgi:hypothetical protein